MKNKAFRLLPLWLLSVFMLGSVSAAEIGFVVGDTVQNYSDRRGAEGALEFLSGRPHISHLEITDYYSGNVVTTLSRGGKYIFWLRFDPTICDDYYDEFAIFKKNRMVVYADWHGKNEGACNITGTGIGIEVPPNAPAGAYSWGGRTTNAYGQDTEYPAYFSIQ